MELQNTETVHSSPLYDRVFVECASSTVIVLTSQNSVVMPHGSHSYHAFINACFQYLKLQCHTSAACAADNARITLKLVLPLYENIYCGIQNYKEAFNQLSSVTDLYFSEVF